jgi:putative transposase
VFFFLLYAVVRRWLRLSCGRPSERALEVENAVLRHQLAVLRRRVKLPRLRRLDRVLMTAASTLLPRERWSSFLVTPHTLLRWHRELVRRKWTYRRKRAPGRPPVEADLRDLVIRMGRENPTHSTNWLLEVESEVCAPFTLLTAARQRRRPACRLNLPNI